MDIVRASTVAALELVLLVSAVPLLAQSKPSSQQGKPTVRRHRVPVSEPSDPAYTRALAEAETALEKKNYAQAETLLKQVVAQDEKNYRGWFDLGHLYALTGRAPDAIAALRKSDALKPDLFETNLNLGMVLASSGQDAEAAKHFRKATTLKPSNPATAANQISSAWMSLGQVLERSNPMDAVSAFRQAATLLPPNQESVEPRLAAGQILLDQKNYAEAQKEYEQILEIKPQSVPALDGLSTALIGQKKFDQAEQVLRRQLAADPQNRAAHLRLGNLQMASQRYDDAIIEFSQVLELSPDDREAKRDLAGAAALAKKYQIAEKLYREIAQAEPHNAEVRFALGTVLMNQRKFPESEAALLEAVNFDPNLADAYGNLAIAASENHHYELALKALDARARSVPENPATYFLRATCYDHLRAFKQASQNYRKFLEVAEGKFPTQEWQARHRLIAIEPKK